MHCAVIVCVWCINFADEWTCSQTFSIVSATCNINFYNLQSDATSIGINISCKVSLSLPYQVNSLLPSPPSRPHPSAPSHAHSGYILEVIAHIIPYVGRSCPSSAGSSTDVHEALLTNTSSKDQSRYCAMYTLCL